MGVHRGTHVEILNHCSTPYLLCTFFCACGAENVCRNTFSKLAGETDKNEDDDVDLDNDTPQLCYAKSAKDCQFLVS